MQKWQRLLYLQNVFVNHIRLMSATRTVIKLDDKVTQDIENEVYKPRKHPGVTKFKSVQIPSNIVKAIEVSTEDFPLKQLVHDGEALNRYLKARHAPVSQEEIKDKYAELQQKLISKKNIDLSSLPEEQRHKTEKYLHNEILQKCKAQVYGWKPIDYDDFAALTYLLGRSAADYAVLIRIFGELNDRAHNFKPRSFLDFGSGVGTGTWAVRNFWKDSIFEYFCVDSSSSMNDLADIVLRGGRGNKPNPLKLISYRQFLPASNQLRYDIVLCAYTLFEMNSPEVRLQKLLNLWNKTEQYLVIVEIGSNAGFRLVTEARDFLLQYDAEVFAPCPHTKPCPRFMTDNTPCNFEVKYSTLPLAATSKIRQELYSYVVLKKKTHNSTSTMHEIENIDKKDDSDGTSQENVTLDSSKWPRIVRPTLVRSKHTVCRMCTAEGNLKEVVVTAFQHGKIPYRCVRSSNWGDLLPITISDCPKPDVTKGKENQKENPKSDDIDSEDDEKKEEEENPKSDEIKSENVGKVKCDA